MLDLLQSIAIVAFGIAVWAILYKQMRKPTMPKQPGTHGSAESVSRVQAASVQALSDIAEVKQAFGWFLSHQDDSEVGEHFDTTCDVVATYRALKHKYPEGA
jgi:hypothetical protein